MDETEKQRIKEYVMFEGVQCVKCQSEDLDFDAPHMDDGLFIRRPVTCVDCDFEFEEVYQLVGIKHEGLETTYYPDEEGQDDGQDEPAIAREVKGRDPR